MLTLKFFLVVIVLIALAVFFLSIGLWIRKNGRFPDTHISHNAEMRKRGIVCVRKWDALEQKASAPVIDKKSLKLDFEYLCGDNCSK